MNRTLAEDYLADCDGDLVTFYQGLRHGYRIGQAFFNALSADDKNKIAGTYFDTFYKDSAESVYVAVEFLTR